MPFFINEFNVTIHLERLECVAEYDASGHSEPYLWTAFLVADDVTLATPTPLLVDVPLATQSGRGLFGAPGTEVKPGDVLQIPANVGRFTRRLHSHVTGSFPMQSEIMFIGFVAVLLEEDSTSDAAITAGHKELGPALKEEILAFYLAEQRFPNADEIATIKEIVSDRVYNAIKNRVGCWSGFWSSQDRLLGVAGDENTLFTASAIRERSGKGLTNRQMPIRSTELAWAPTPFGSTIVQHEHHYVLHWNIKVDAVEPVVKADAAIRIEDVGTKIEELDIAVAGLVNKLRTADAHLVTNLQADIHEKIKRVRPTLLRDFEVAWTEFAKTVDSDRGYPSKEGVDKP